VIMQLTELTTTAPEASKSMSSVVDHSPDPINWSQAFNTSILSTVLDSKSLDGEIETILATPEYEAILLAAKSLSLKLQLSPEAATERLIQTFRNIDSCWEKVLLKKGAQSLLGL